MNTPSIEILISPTGEITIQTKGFSGASCREASKTIERALGIVTADTPTPELYQTQTAHQPIRQNNG